MNPIPAAQKNAPRPITPENPLIVLQTSNRFGDSDEDYGVRGDRCEEAVRHGQEAVRVWRDTIPEDLRPYCQLQVEIRTRDHAVRYETFRRLFDVFEQVDSTLRRKHGGTGLGLAIASRLVELMKGRIWVESEVGQGSRFHFTVSLGAAKEEAGAAPPAEPACLHGLPVLVVDDKPDDRAAEIEKLSEFCKFRDCRHETEPGCAVTAAVAAGDLPPA